MVESDDVFSDGFDRDLGMVPTLCMCRVTLEARLLLLDTVRATSGNRAWTTADGTTRWMLDKEVATLVSYSLKESTDLGQELSST